MKELKLQATCVRVPVFISHSESVNIEFDSPLSEKKAQQVLSNSEGISVVDYRKDEAM